MQTFKDKRQIINRLKLALNLKTDQDLANSIGVAKSTMSSWSSRNTIDYDLIFEICKNNSISLDWLLLDKGTIHFEDSEKYKQDMEGSDDQNQIERLVFEVKSNERLLQERAETIETLKDQLNVKDKQLKEKDEQISQLIRAIKP